MFGIWKSKQQMNEGDDTLCTYQHALVPDYQGSVSGFYESIEKELEARKVPGLEMSRIEFAEGGLLSAKRVYLRVRRERLIFDICSSPFGTSWFFSYRSGFIPFSWSIWQFVFLLAVLSLLYLLYPLVFGLLWGSVVFGLTVIGGLVLLNAIASSGNNDLDSKLLKIPILGSLYEVFFRPDTYYRKDSRIMYQELLKLVVETQVKDETAEAGIENVAFTETLPLQEGLVALLAHWLNP